MPRNTGRKPPPDHPRCPTCSRKIGSAPLGPWGIARAAAGLSCREAAAIVGISASTVSRADYDGEALTLSAASRLAKAYGVTLDSMIPADQSN